MSTPDTGSTDTPAATDGARPPGPATVVNYVPPPPDTDDTPEPADLAAEVEKWKALAHKHEQRAKKNATDAQKLAQLEADKGSDLEKAVNQARAEAEKTAQARYTQRLASLSIKAAASAFQDPDDAVALLGSRVSEFVDDDGDVDDKAIRREVEALLKTRPYLGKTKPPADFDGGQRNGATGVVNMDRLIRNQAGIRSQ